jgi:hypothetical protein
MGIFCFNSSNKFSTTLIYVRMTSSVGLRIRKNWHSLRTEHRSLFPALEVYAVNRILVHLEGSRVYKVAYPVGQKGNANRIVPERLAPTKSRNLVGLE